MRNIITEKIIELAEEAKSCSETNAAIVLFSLAGSMKGEEDCSLAEKVQDFTKHILMPKIQSKIDQAKISNN